MAFFRKPQEKKSSAVREDAQAGKRALSGEKSGFHIPFFGKDKKREATKPEGVGVPSKSVGSEKKDVDAPKTPAREQFGSASRVILRPRVTEKGSDLASKSNAYAFDVHPSANKNQIASGIKEMYGVDVVKVAIVQVPSKRVRSRRGHTGVKSGGKKAYVYLKKGDTIEFV